MKIPYFSKTKNFILALSGKKLEIILEPSKGGIGIKLKKAKSKFKKQKIIDITKITAKKLPEILFRIKLFSPEK